VLDWAKARGYREGENAARWRGHLDHLLPPRNKVRRVRHHPALPYAEAPDFLIELSEHRGIASYALEFLILTAARTNEALGALWPEIDFAQRLWTVPSERMKMGSEHRVPLPTRAIEILRDMGQLPRVTSYFLG
jgi:integrase